MSKQVGQAFFKHIKDRKPPSLFKKMMRSIDSGQYHIPKSFKVLSKFPTEELKLQYAPAVKLQIPENHLIKHFYEKYPEAKQEPVKLQSLDPPVARQFVWRQLSLMRREKLTPAQAFSRVEEEMTTQLRELRRRANVLSSHVGLIQQEEELQLRSALDQTAARRPQ